MTSASLAHDFPQTESGPPEDRLRLKLKPKSATVTGFVDGGWWPRSRDLRAELPALVGVLTVRLGQVERVGYRLADWDPTANRLVVDGALVHLDGYRSRSAGTVDLIAREQRVTLLVVPPDTDPEMAHQALLAAGHRGNTDAVAQLLTSPTAPDGTD
jgi:Family of unknown function (DUF5994)